MTVQPEIRKQTIQVSAGTAILSAVMILVYVLLGRFSLPVLLGAVLGTAAASLNFFLLGLSVQKAAEETYRSAKATPMEEVSSPADETADASEALVAEEPFAAEAPAVVSKGTRAAMQLSHTLRLLMIGAVALIGWLVPCFDGIATILPILFPQIVFAFIIQAEKKKEKNA